MKNAWAIIEGGIFPLNILAETPDKSSRIVSRVAWIAPTFYKNILVVNNIPIDETKFDSRCCPTSVEGYCEKNKYWYGSCHSSSDKYVIWIINVNERWIRFSRISEINGIRFFHN